ncbi:NUDIX domain-containing protein [Belnapia rosea]|uniref:GDP-mannose pyrophosphatase n=1 Tax=Belnapia rosea TaxID=938405 RepID=A0A1G6L6M4_9PROT|nr:NUDIX hydrolase [Belnapia rosea]SDC38969.1 ADP-ribose pyrophosphatase [Belnapia rosea]
MTDEPEITTLGTTLVYQNRWMRVREDAIRWRDGSTGIYGVVEKPDFVAILPREADGSVHLVEQYRYPIGRRVWEFPQGAWEGKPEADPLEVARGELREETGLVAGRMTYAGRFFQGYGYSTQACHVFLAEALSQGEASLEQEEQGLVTRRVPAAEFERMLRDGEIEDSTTLAVLALLRAKGLLP